MADDGPQRARRLSSTPRRGDRSVGGVDTQSVRNLTRAIRCWSGLALQLLESWHEVLQLPGARRLTEFWDFPCGSC